MNSSTPEMSVRIAAVYHFFALADPAQAREGLVALCRELGIKGTLILAYEGINGTVAGRPSAIEKLAAHIADLAGGAELEIKFADAAEMPFYRMKVRIKNEIVTMGAGPVDPASEAGSYVEAGDWNALISDPQTIVVDTRNDYEVAIGTFAGAVNPQTQNFREFPDWVKQNRENFEGRKVAMFCTGGIRCEKATAFVKSLGVDDVYHLRGGILRYLEDVPEGESLWQGECFVFDERVSVTHGLEKGQAELCRACRHPLMPEDRKSPHYHHGISCPYCHETRSEEDRKRYADRQRQVELADRRGQKHIGR
jgi:UPF0176 protein